MYTVPTNNSLSHFHQAYIFQVVSLRLFVCVCKHSNQSNDPSLKQGNTAPDGDTHYFHRMCNITSTPHMGIQTYMFKCTGFHHLYPVHVHVYLYLQLHVRLYVPYIVKKPHHWKILLPMLEFDSSFSKFNTVNWSRRATKNKKKHAKLSKLGG